MPTPNATSDHIEAMTKDGRTPREIARLLDLSTQAVYYHLNRLQAKEAHAGDDSGGSRPT